MHCNVSTYCCYTVGLAEVAYSVVHQSSSPSDVLLTPNNTVRFTPGQTQASITVNVVNDTIPEEQELLMLSLVSVSVGDAVLVSPTQATLVIELSDDPNGVFNFSANSLLVQAEEGDVLQLM